MSAGAKGPPAEPGHARSNAERPSRAAAPGATIDPDASLGWFRRLLPLFAAHRFVIGGALLASLVMIAAGIVVPRIVMEAIDVSLTKRERPMMDFVWLLAAIAALRAIGAMCFRYGIQWASQTFEYDLRTAIYEHLATLSFGFYDRVQTGQLISRANADIRAIQMFLSMAPLMAMTLFAFAGSLAVMLTIHPLLTLTALVPIPGVYLLGLQMRGKLFPISWVISARQAEVATIVEENVTGVRIVKSFAAEGQQVGALYQAAERLRWVTLKQVQIRSFFGPMMENLPRVGRALVLLYGGWLAIEGHVTIGALVAVNM